MSSNYTTRPDPALSRDPVHRVAQYQTAGVNARLKVLALLQARGTTGDRRRLIFNGTVVETGTGSYRLASARAWVEEPTKAG